MAFNMGLRPAMGNIIVLQNPECFHVHDILTYFNENINDSNYITISTYGLDPEMTESLPQHPANNTIIDLFNSLPQKNILGVQNRDGIITLEFRPTYYHFCSAMTKKNMAKLNGFDERFAHGIGYDDDEFIARIKILGLKMIIEDNLSVLHQYHKSVYGRLSAA